MDRQAAPLGPCKAMLLVISMQVLQSEVRLHGGCADLLGQLQAVEQLWAELQAVWTSSSSTARPVPCPAEEGEEEEEKGEEQEAKPKACQVSALLQAWGTVAAVACARREPLQSLQCAALGTAASLFRWVLPFSCGAHTAGPHMWQGGAAARVTADCCSVSDYACGLIPHTPHIPVSAQTLAY